MTLSEDDKKDEIHTEIEYNPEFEQLLKENGDHAQVYSILHQMAYIKYKHRFDWLNIPLIVMTAVIGFVTGIGLTYEHMGIILGASSVFVSIMKSIISYMKLSERSENHRICSLQFGQISNELKIELSLRREQRQPAKILLDVIKVKFKNLLEVAQLIDYDVIHRFREKYLTDYDPHQISLPPVFENIPGIKILGGDDDEEFINKLRSNFEKYQTEKRFELQTIEFDLDYQLQLKILREAHREKQGESDTDGESRTRPSVRRQGSATPVRPESLTGWNLTGKSPLSSIPETPSNQVVLPTATLTDVD